MKATAPAGPFAGAPLLFENQDGKLIGTVVENVGFRRVGEEDLKWYTLDNLPSLAEFKEAIGGGGQRVEIQINAMDHEGVRNRLLALGFPVGEVQEIRPGNWRGEGVAERTAASSRDAIGRRNLSRGTAPVVVVDGRVARVVRVKRDM